MLVRWPRTASLLLASSVLLLFACAHKKLEPLRVGYHPYLPYVIPRAGQAPDGIAAELIIQAAARAGVALQWIPLHKEPAESALARRAVDVYPLMTVTKDREKRFRAAPVWWESQMALVSLEPGVPASREGTRGRHIVTRGTPMADHQARLLFPDAVLSTIPKLDEMIPALCAGRVDGVFQDVRLIQAQLLTGQSCSGRPLHVIPTPEADLMQSTLAAAGANPSVDALFREIERLTENGTLTALAAKWSVYDAYDGRYVNEALEARHRDEMMRFGLAGLLLTLVLICWQARRVRRARAWANAAHLDAQGSRSRFDAFMRYTPALTYIKDSRGRMEYVNDAYCRQLETSLEEVRGKRDNELWPPEIAEQLQRNDAAVLENNRGMELTEAVFLPSGELRHFLSLKFPFTNPRGERFLGGVSLDITERMRVEEALRFSQFSLDHSPDTILWIDAVGHIFYANNAACANLGLDREALNGMAVGMFDPAWSFERFSRLRQELRLRRSIRMESTHLRKDGRAYPVEVSVSFLEFKGREFMCCLARDITERKRAEKELSHQAMHDPLSGLPNRRMMEARLAEELETARARESTLALLYLDLDGFKLVNDTMGHAAGDSLLKQCAVRLRATAGATCTLARMGGDEFTILMTDLVSENQAEELGHSILATIQDPFLVEDNEVLLTASLGISIFPRHGFSATSLLQSADAAMYESKRRGKNRLQFFTPEMGESARERLELEHHLRRALGRGELSLHFQPQVSLHHGGVVRCEALLRWTHPLLGSIPPMRFIPIAEETGVIVPIGTWVMEEACRQAQLWSQNTRKGVGVSVNVSVVQFMRPDFLETVTSILERTGLPARMLELELTESVIMQGLADAVVKINQIRELGVSVSIDDFGTGYSSLSYLQRLPIDNLKIDRSFISDIANDPGSVALTASLVSLAHSLGMKVVIEGIETSQQLEAVRQMGCDMVQGFLIGRPAPCESVADLLQQAPAA